MKIRNLDGYFFRVERDGEWQSICFSDLTHTEREEAIAHFDKESLVRLAIGLADSLEHIGNQFDLEYVPVENI